MKLTTWQLTALIFTGFLISSCNSNAQQNQPLEGQTKSHTNPQGHPHKRPSPEILIKHLDKNKDGKLSYKELRGPIKKDFKKIDANKDGFIDITELKKMPKPKMEGNHPQRDTRIQDHHSNQSHQNHHTEE